MAACYEEKSVHRAAQIADGSLDSCLTSTESPGGISIVGSSQAAVKKRPWSMFVEGESLAWESDMLEEKEILLRYLLLSFCDRFK